MNIGALQDSIAHLLAAGHRVILLVGPPGSGKSRFLRDLKDVGIVNVGVELARELIPLSQTERPQRAVAALGELINTHSHATVVLDNVELLLRSELGLDLWAALATLSAEKQLIVAWTGRMHGDELYWAEPGFPGHRAISMENCPAAILSMTG